MAYFHENDARHPTNRCHTLYLAALQAPGPGIPIPQDQWRSMVKIATGVMAQKQVTDYSQTMEDFLMVKRNGTSGVTILLDGLRLLNDSVESP